MSDGLVSVESVRSDQPGGPATTSGADEACAAAGRAERSVGELLTALKQAGQRDEVIDELERTRAMLQRVYRDLERNKGKGTHAAVKGEQYGMKDAANDMMGDIRSERR